MAHCSKDADSVQFLPIFRRKLGPMEKNHHFPTADHALRRLGFSIKSFYSLVKATCKTLSVYSLAWISNETGQGYAYGIF